jgi:catechol 2,3-dioxygenase-like lactoylglutathione lyase family enzyme
MRVQHVRIARATSRLAQVVAFYCDVLGLSLLASFTDHEGFDGAMVGQPQTAMHFEFTRERGVVVDRVPSSEDLVVLYFDEHDWVEITTRIAAAGIPVIPSHNPYWNRHGVTVQDPDGYRVVLHRGVWQPV